MYFPDKTHVKNVRAHHDLPQHLTAIPGFIDSWDMEVLAAYVQDYGKELPPEPVLCVLPCK